MTDVEKCGILGHHCINFRNAAAALVQGTHRGTCLQELMPGGVINAFLRPSEVQATNHLELQTPHICFCLGEHNDNTVAVM